MKKRRKVQAIIYDRKNGTTYYLILHRILRWTGWELLKETIENDESYEQAIRRGVEEETSLKNFKIIKEINKKIEFAGNAVIERVFIIKADREEKIDLTQEIPEHDQYKWATKEEAMGLLMYDNAKELIKRAKL